MKKLIVFCAAYWKKRGTAFSEGSEDRQFATVGDAQTRAGKH